MRNYLTKKIRQINALVISLVKLFSQKFLPKKHDNFYHFHTHCVVIDFTKCFSTEKKFSMELQKKNLTFSMKILQPMNVKSLNSKGFCLTFVNYTQIVCFYFKIRTTVLSKWCLYLQVCNTKAFYVGFTLIS